MSKFFDRIQKEDWTALEDPAKKLNVQQALQAVKETTKGADSVAAEMRAHRLAPCRKLELPQISRAPLILPRNSFAQFAIESYRALRTRLMRLQRETGLRSIVMTSAMPGEGKTLTALNLALCCAQLHDSRILLIDADLRTHALTDLLGAPQAPGLAEILAGQAEPERAILAANSPSLHVLGAGKASVSPPELFAGQRWKDFIGWCSESFNIILVDSPPILPLADFELIAGGCDGVMMVVRAQTTRRDLLRKAMGQVDRKKVIGTVFNGAKTKKSDHYYHHYSGNGNHK